MRQMTRQEILTGLLVTELVRTIYYGQYETLTIDDNKRYKPRRGLALTIVIHLRAEYRDSESSEPPKTINAVIWLGESPNIVHRGVIYDVVGDLSQGKFSLRQNSNGQPPPCEVA